MLKDGRVATRLPAQDLNRARAFYAEKLGLEPVEERKGDHTQMGWEVEDLEETVADLRSRGVVFEEYDLPGFTTVDGIADIEGNYPSKGTGERAVWFRDSEGNLLGIGEPYRR